MILQATPLVVVLGASIFFNEKVGIIRWLAIGVGFIGVLMIVNPEEKEFNFRHCWLFWACSGLRSEI